jgi:thiamine biosynthesis protein ThiI
MNRVVVRYHEVALKGGNRSFFVGQLAANMVRALDGTGVHRHHRAPGRIILHLPSPEVWPEVRARLRHVFGIANFLLCESGCASLIELGERILKRVDGGAESFAVRTKRCDKTFPIQSPQVSAELGSIVQERTGMRVDLGRPDLEIHVEILPREILFSVEKVQGPGGLPNATGGTAVALLSGGIDSPVAAYRILHRGCRLEFVHFHGAPYQNRSSCEKAAELVEVLRRWQPDSRLHLVPFGDIQREIVSHVGRRPRVVLYRRMMVRIAAAIAARLGATALVTGDSLGQVASQTLANLAVTEAASPIPILRPLIGMDKQEIMAQAEHLNTFEISIQPVEDCCQLFVPKHPSTRMTVDEALSAERPLDIDALVTTALSKVTMLDRRTEARSEAPEAAPLIATFS